MASDAAISKIKRWIWIYFWLLIFEGALRKWIFPGFQKPLLLVRDPVVIWIYVLAISAGVFPKNRFISAIVGLGIATFFVSLVVPGSRMLVTLYGLRTGFLHLPLIFLIPNVFTIEDVKKIGKWTLLVSLPMTLLMIIQFVTPDGSVWNRGTLGDWGVMETSMGKFRLPGTFSFYSGVALFYSLVTSFVLYGILRKKTYKILLIFIASLGLIIAIGISGGRAVLGASLTVVLMAVFSIVIRPRLSSHLLKFFIIASIVFAIASSVSVFKEGKASLKMRFEEAGGIKRGVVDRVIGGYMHSIRLCAGAPLLGCGIGVGTNVGAVLLTDRLGGAYFIESDLDRNILEGGLLLGLPYIFLRLAIVFFLFRVSYKSLVMLNALPMLLFGASAPNVLSGTLAQPNWLGFAVFASGLCLAAANSSKTEKAKCK